MTRQELEDKLKAIGSFPNSVPQSADILGRCKTLQDVAEEMVRIGSSCGNAQYVFFHFKALLNYDIRFKERFLSDAKLRLQPSELSQSILKNISNLEQTLP